jgi:hypothetical protein
MRAKIHAYSQSTMIGKHDRGTCYYQCEFVWTSADLWKSVTTYAEAVEKAMAFKTYKKMANYAFSRRSQKVPQQFYTALTGALAVHAIYSVELYFGAGPAAAANHEIIAVTNGGGDDVVFFDPNFGLYQADRGSSSTCLRAAAGVGPAPSYRRTSPGWSASSGTSTRATY